MQSMSYPQYPAPRINQHSAMVSVGVFNSGEKGSLFCRQLLTVVVLYPNDLGFAEAEYPFPTILIHRLVHQ